MSYLPSQATQVLQVVAAAIPTTLTLTLDKTSVKPGELVTASGILTESGELTPTQWDQFWSIGDVNRDGYINQTDLDLYAAKDPRADLNQDGKIDYLDLYLISKNSGLNIWDYFGIHPGIPLVGLPVFLLINATDLGSVTTGTDGRFTLTFEAPGIGTYTVTATFHGTPVLASASASINLGVSDWHVEVLPVIGTVALAVVDIVLIGTYLASQLVK